MPPCVLRFTPCAAARPTVDALAKSVLDAWPGAVKQFFAPITQSSKKGLANGKVSITFLFCCRRRG